MKHTYSRLSIDLNVFPYPHPVSAPVPRVRPQFVKDPLHCVPVSASVCAVDIPGFGVPGPSGKFPPGDYALYRCADMGGYGHPVGTAF